MRSFTRLDARSRFAIGVDRKEDGMTVLSVMAIKGDPRQLVAGMKEKIEPIARRKAAQYGAISSTIVRTDDGIKIFNLWKTEEGRHKMAADPDVRQALKSAGFPEPSFKAKDVLSHSSAGEFAKELSERLTKEVWNRGNLAAIDELIAPDYVGFDPVDGEFHGPEGFRKLVQQYRSAFPDTRMTIDLQVAEGDWVATFWTATGTQRGELFGMAPTGREMRVSGVQFSRVENGKFVEGRGLFDALSLMQQLGAIPAGTPVGARA
jgi:steroid delta-isomerase-like uncharacterized protein